METRRATVLVVDDRSDRMSTLCAVLSAAGFRAEPTPVQLVEKRLLGSGLNASPRSLRVAAVIISMSDVAAASETVSGLRQRPEPPLRDAALVAIVDDEYDLFFGLGEWADITLERPVAADRLVEAVTDVAATQADVRRARLNASPIG